MSRGPGHTREPDTASRPPQSPADLGKGVAAAAAAALDAQLISDEFFFLVLLYL